MKTHLFIFDEPLVTLTMSAVFLQASSYSLMGTAHQASQLFEKLQTYQPDVLLINPQLCSKPELESLKEQLENRGTQIIVFDTQPCNSLPTATLLQRPANISKHTFPLEAFEKLLVHSPGQAPLMQLPGSDATIKVMLVDDSSLVKLVVENALREHPALKLVTHAKNGKVALEQLPQIMPDIILLDLEMPVMDGVSFLKQARSRTQAKIIVMSTITHQKTEQLKSLGADGLFEKPENLLSLNLQQQSGSRLASDIMRVVQHSHFLIGT